MEITDTTKINLAGKDITLEIYNPDGTLNRTVSCVTDNDGKFVYDYSDIPVDEYTYKATYMNGDSQIIKEGSLYDMVSGNTFNDIQKAINNAEVGSTLYLKNITYTNDNHGEILINKAITIIGSDGTILDAQGDSRIFNIEDNTQNVNIENIVLSNGHTNDQENGGGAILIGGNCQNINISDCDFKDNAAVGSGGAIGTKGWAANNVNINGCYFEGNNATKKGGAISSSANELNIDNCLFVDNSASDQESPGTAVSSTGSDSRISNSAFTGKCELNVIREYQSLVSTLTVDMGDCINSQNIVKDNLSYWDGSSKIPVDMSSTTKINLTNRNLTLTIYDENGDVYRGPITNLTDDNGQWTYDYQDIPFGEYTYNIYYMNGDSKIQQEGDLFNIVKGNTFYDIQQAIDNTPAGSILYLKGITYTNNIGDSIKINKAITIIGSEGTVLDAEGKSGIFDITQQNNKANIENITFLNGNASNGGAINIHDGWESGLTSINNCQFVDNNANTGQAIYANANSIVSNSTFKQINDLHVSGEYQALAITLDTDYNGAISGNINKENLSYWDGDSYENYEEPPIMKMVNQPVTIEIYNKTTGQLVDNKTRNTDDKGQVNYDYSHIPLGEYTYKIYNFYGDSKVQKEGNLYSIVEGNKFSDIQRAIDAAGPGTTVYLRNVTYTNDNDGMVIDKPLTVIGVDGTVLDAEGKSRIFTINNGVSDVTLNHISFVNGSVTDGNGGAVFVGDGDNIIITNSNFTNNKVFSTTGNQEVGKGGAIYISTNSNVGTLSNLTFDNNTADIGGGAVCFEQSYGWNVYNSTFINNTAFSIGNDHGRDVPNGGGAMWSCAAEVNVYNSTFIENKGSYGGALRGCFNTEDSDFYFNVATNGNGGAIDVTIDTNKINPPLLWYINSTFVNNTAKGDRADQRSQGGALHMFHIENVDVIGCTCINNTADRGGALDLFIISTVDVENCTITDNSALSEGGALYINTTSTPSTFFNSDISNNHAGTTGGAICLVANGAIFENVTSVNNTAPIGGSTYIEGNNTLVRNCTVSNNTALYDGSMDSGLGGAFYIIGNNCTLFNVTSNDNEGYRGGSTFIRGDGTKVINSTFNNNNATLRGGALNIGGTNTQVYNVTSVNNTAPMGGSTYIAGSNTILKNCNLSNNTALYNGSEETGLGGALYILGDNTNMTNIISNDNKGYRGGSTFIRGHDTKVSNSTFDNNDATKNGGALNIGGYDTIVYNVETSNNHAGKRGGGIYIEGSSAELNNINAENNSAEYGGAIAVIGHETDIKNSEINNNSAIEQAGAIYIEGDNVLIYNNNITFNKAVGGTELNVFAGAIGVQCEDTSVINITKNNISSNHATDNGGAIFAGFEGDGILIIDQVYAYNNTAENGGFAGVIACPELDVTNSTFESNHATGDIFGQPDRGEGGAFNLAFVDEANIQGNFYNNTAMNGSAIYMSLLTMLNVHDSEFIDNQAHSYHLIVVPKDNETYQLGEDVEVIISHIGGDNVINAIHVADDEVDAIALKNVTYPYYNNGKFENRTISPNEYTTPVLGYENSNDGEYLYLDDLEDNQVIYYKILNDKNETVAQGSNITDISGSIKLTFKDLPVGNYKILATYDETTYYTEIADTGSFRIVSENSLDVRKIALNKTVYVGEQSIFTIDVNNTGKNNLTEVYVIENVPTGLIYAGYINGTRNWNVEKINDNTYNFTLVGNLTVNASASFNVIFNTTTNGTFTNVVVAGSNQTGETSANNDTIVLGPNMTVVKKTLNMTVIVGDQTAFTIIVNNTGDCSLGNVTVVEKVPNGLIYADYVNVIGSWNVEKINDTAYRFTLVGDLAKKGIASFNVIFNTTTNGTFTNVVVAKSNVTENKTANNDTIVLGPNMTVVKITLNTTVYVGEQTAFTIILGNVTVVEKVPAGLTFDDYANVTGSWKIEKINETAYRFILVGDLAEGGIASFKVIFNTTVAGNFTNVVVAKSNVTKETSANNNTTVLILKRLQILVIISLLLTLIKLILLKLTLLKSGTILTIKMELDLRMLLSNY